MDFHYSYQALEGRERRLQRCFEILPGLASWSALIGMILISCWKPLVGAVLVIVFDLYWLLRLFYLTVFLILAYLRLSLEKSTDWMARVRGLDRLEEYSRNPVPAGHSLKWGDRISLLCHRHDMARLVKSGSKPPASDSIYHLVILPVLRETPEVFEPGIRSLAEQTFPSDQILVVIALEERAPGAVKGGAEKVQKNYRHNFYDFLVFTHPQGVPGEGKVKGANATYAARQAAAYLETKKIPFEQVIVSCFDSDTVVPPEYFACLTYNFAITPRRTRASFQPIPVYHNNIWEAPGFSRVIETGSSFFQLSEATNPEKLVTFSSHSMSFKALVETGYWPVDMISDDSAIFWKTYIHYDGDYRVIPMYVTLSMDVVNAGSWWQTAVNVYKQKRRWAWGVENFPLVMRAFLKDKKIPFYDKLRHAFKLFEGHVAWATWPILVTLIGWLPVLLAGREFSNSVLYYSAPRITAIIFNLASLGLVTSITLSILLLPKKKVKNPLLKRVALAFEWLLVPVIVTLLSALPALDAQTRLMFGRYMTDFWPTEKHRL